MNTETQTYNGWTNYDTWNVWLWITNTEELYTQAVQLSKSQVGSRIPAGYSFLIAYLKHLVCLIEDETPDGVPWESRTLNKGELDQAFWELANH
jgi:hypothetical protein